ncbi:hypothetical protein GEMRC1_004183 [Eukaryota sp. GEM-RC1]
MDVSSDSASALVTRHPQQFCFNLKHHQWLVKMRLRFGLWTNGLLLQKSYTICSKSMNATFNHVAIGSKLIHMRSVIRNSDRGQCLSMFRSNSFHSKVEPLLSAFSDSVIQNKSRGDLIGA